MTRYFCGNSFAHFNRLSSVDVENTGAGRFDSAYVPSCINMPGQTDFITTPNFSATGTIWLRYDHSFATALGGIFPVVELKNGVTGVFRIVGLGSTTAKAQYWNGSTWFDTGSAFTYATPTLYTVAVKVILNSSFEIYIGGTLVAFGSGWSGGGTTVTNCLLYAAATTVNAFSQVMIADYDIRDSHYNFTGIDGNSLVNTGGTGTFTDVNETVLNDSTSITVATVGNKMGQTKAALVVPPGYRIAAMVIGARGRATGGTVVDGKLGVRTAGGSNNSGSALGYNAGYEPRVRIIDNDPDTGVPFTQAGYNGAQVYEEGA